MYVLNLISAVAIFAASAGAPEGKLVLVVAGRSDYEIVVAADALPTTRLAAEELRRYVARATNVQLPIVDAPSAGLRQIYISSTDRLKPHGFAIQAYGGDLFLRGHDSAGRSREVDYVEPVFRGTCNAVYEFLERFVGVRWYWSDALGEIVPRMARLTVPADLVIKQEPRFDYRALVYGPSGSREGDWARRNRLGAEFQMRHAHALQRLVPVEEWARRGHPEYASMRDGTRRTQAARGGSGGHVCTGNPDVVRLVAAAAIEYFKVDPDHRSFSISPPDGSSVCTCELCTRYDVPGRTVPRGIHRGWPIISDRILTFYNSVAQIVSQEFPDRLLGGYAYMDYLYPPARVPHAHPMLMLVVAPNEALDTWNDDVWSFYQDLFKAWGAFHDRVYVYDTCVLSRRMYGLPAPLGDRCVDLVRLIAEAGMRGAYLYIGPTWESTGADSYLLARLLWDPDTDAERVRREYYGVLYQRAAGPVRAYFETAQRCWREATTHDRSEIRRLAALIQHAKPYAREAFAGLIVGYGPNLADLERHIVDAERLAAGDEALAQRVARLRDSFTLTAATVRGLAAVIDYERDPGKDRRHLAALVSAIEQREALIKRVGLSYAPVLKESLRFADENVDSPLRFGGPYHRLSKR